VEGKHEELEVKKANRRDVDLNSYDRTIDKTREGVELFAHDTSHEE